MRNIKVEKKDNSKLNLRHVRSGFENSGYILVSKKYKNARQKLKYVCPKGHKHFISWDKWRQGKRCPYCAGNARHNMKFIKQNFENEGYILLTDYYINGKQRLNYICNEGHNNNMCWNNWQQGRRCPTCKYIKIATDHSIKFVGQNNPNWKGGISCEPYCFEWSSKEFKDFIKERDDYRCLNPDCWKTSKRLSVHHIDYDKKNCEQSNLITLCTSCNSRANKDREWHKSWYKVIIKKRSNYMSEQS